MKIDAHQHFWTRSDGFYDWLTPDLGAINRDFVPTDLEASLVDSGVGSTILVQAAPSIDETKLLLALAERTTFVHGVIGWVDLESDNFAGDLWALKLHPLLKGIRPMVQDLEDPNWLMKPVLGPAFDLLASTKLVFEALVRPLQWDALLAFAKQYDNLPIIVNHGAKPAIRNELNGDAGFSVWAVMIDQLSAHQHVTCKLSGLLTEAAPGATVKEIKPYLDHLYDCFGPDRLMWGSDWPVLLLNATYGSWVSMVETWLQDKPQSAAEKIFSKTAGRLYGIQDGLAKSASEPREAKAW